VDAAEGRNAEMNSSGEGVITTKLVHINGERWSQYPCQHT